MSYSMSPVESSLADDSYYDTYADFVVGSNGDPNGDPTTAIGDLYGDENWAFNTWDAAPSGGFDTNPVAISFDVNSDGSEILTVSGQSTLNYQTNPIGAISSVVLEAAVTINAEASWSNVSVKFFDNGSLVETDSGFSGPDANTIDSGSNTVADQTMTITPTVKNADEALVTGNIRLRSPGNNNPSPGGMFCNVFVNGSAG